MWLLSYLVKSCPFCIIIFFKLQIFLKITSTPSRWDANKHIYIKLRFCQFISSNHAKLWLHTFQAKLWTKTLSTKFPSVCLSVCIFPRKVSHDSRQNGWRDYYEIPYLNQMSSNLRYIAILYILTPKRGLEERTNWNYQITLQLLTLRHILLWPKL